MPDKDQSSMFPLGNAWDEKWAGMPEFKQEDQMPWQTVKVHFHDQEGRDEFASLMGQTIGSKTPSIWYPEAERGTTKARVFTEADMSPRYPVYVISKGRWESRLTVKALESMSVRYSIVIEPQEREFYEAVIKPENILVLPFSNLGQGSIPARNWVWEHAVSLGAERHWIIDDNIRSFMRLNDNKKMVLTTGEPFRAVEIFAERYNNVALAGMNYQFFAKQKQRLPPFVLNTRIYSCILIKNDIPYRWRGRYNEDTDLSLRALKDGFCTVQFNAFLADKMTTMSMSGGNTDELYQADGRLEMAQSLQQQHPDVVGITQKFGRWQHQVNYKPFKRNKLIQRKRQP